jgi:hypothetical protein
LVRVAFVGWVVRRLGKICCTPSMCAFIKWGGKGVVEVAHTCWGKSHREKRWASFSMAPQEAQCWSICGENLPALHQ